MSNLLFSPTGRLGRNAFWRGIILCLAAAIIVRVLEAFVAMPFGLAAMLLLWPYFCLYAKRFHDAGQSAGLFGLVVIGYVFTSSIVGSTLAPMIAPDYMQMQQDVADIMFAGDFSPETMDKMTELAQQATKEGILVTLISLVASNALLAMLVGLLPSDPNTNRHGPPTSGAPANL